MIYLVATGQYPIEDPRWPRKTSLIGRVINNEGSVSTGSYWSFRVNNYFHKILGRVPRNLKIMKMQGG